MKRITATFIGTDGSMGYRYWASYKLLIDISHNGNTRIRCIDGSQICEYSNILTFLDNWSNIISE